MIHNMQGLFSLFLNERPPKDIIIQLIQCANILIHNLDSESHKSIVYSEYLLESCFFELLVKLDFDFSNDEDLVENYMSFLKGLAANLSESLLLTYVIKTKFAVFTQAYKFFNYSDAMIKNASRTTVLTIIKRKG